MVASWIQWKLQNKINKITKKQTQKKGQNISHIFLIHTQLQGFISRKRGKKRNEAKITFRKVCVLMEIGFVLFCCMTLCVFNTQQTFLIANQLQSIKNLISKIWLNRKFMEGLYFIDINFGGIKVHIFF